MSVVDPPHVSILFSEESPKAYAARMMSEAEAYSVGRPLSHAELEAAEGMFDAQVWRTIAMAYRAMCSSLLEQQHQEYLKQRAARS